MFDVARYVESLGIKKGDFFTVVSSNHADYKYLIGHCLECMVVDYPFVRAKCYVGITNPVFTIPLNYAEIQPLSDEFVASVFEELSRLIKANRT